MQFSLGFSPCPNDTFIFDAIVNHRIDTHGLDFRIHVADVEELNQLASKGALDVTKVSFNAFLHLTDNYVLLDSGSALGRNCGPLLVGLKDISPDDLMGKKVAIPGFNTTANLLMSLIYPRVQDKTEVLFSRIFDEVISGRVDAGLIIHEGRFTYAARGLRLIADLGVEWDKLTSVPIPLGGIVARRSIPSGILHRISGLIADSIAFAFNNPGAGRDYIKSHAQELADDVMMQHIKLYVNNFSLNLGPEGRAAVQRLAAEAVKAGMISAPAGEKLFLD